MAVTEGSLTRKLNKTAVRLWTWPAAVSIGLSAPKHAQIC
jgi:hypothetical protein